MPEWFPEARTIICALVTLFCIAVFIIVVEHRSASQKDDDEDPPGFI